MEKFKTNIHTYILREAVMLKTQPAKLTKLSLKKGDKVLIQEYGIGNGRIGFKACRVNENENTVFDPVPPSAFEYTEDGNYTVCIARTETAYHDFAVKAKTAKEAQEKAMAMAGDVEFSSGEATYEVTYTANQDEVNANK